MKILYHTKPHQSIFCYLCLTPSFSLGLNRDAILEEWGLPDRTYVMSGDEFMQISAGWGSGSGRFGFFKGKVPLDVWVYEK